MSSPLLEATDTKDIIYSTLGIAGVPTNTAAAYVQTQSIRGCAECLVQKVAFTIMSHDQGFSDNTGFVGSYVHSWTGFRVRILKADGGQTLGVDDNWIQVNVHGSAKWRTHIVIYGHGKHVRKRKWLDQINSGDAIQVVPWAKWPGWTNYVRRVQDFNWTFTDSESTWTV